MGPGETVPFRRPGSWNISETTLLETENESRKPWGGRSGVLTSASFGHRSDGLRARRQEDLTLVPLSRNPSPPSGRFDLTVPSPATEVEDPRSHRGMEYPDSDPSPDLTCIGGPSLSRHCPVSVSRQGFDVGSPQSLGLDDWMKPWCPGRSRLLRVFPLYETSCRCHPTALDTLHPSPTRTPYSVHHPSTVWSRGGPETGWVGRGRADGLLQALLV